MRTGIIALVLGALLGLSLPAAAKSGFITDKYAKQLVVKKVSDHYGQVPWKVTLYKGSSTASKFFTAKVNWGNKPHIQIVVPNSTGVVNVVKGPTAPDGLERVKLFAPK